MIHLLSNWRLRVVSFCTCLFCGMFVLGPVGCQESPKTIIEKWEVYDESEMLASVKNHEVKRMQLKLIQSKISDQNIVWDAIRDDIAFFVEEDYTRLYPLIYEQDIPSIQQFIKEGKLSYEELTKWYLYRIVKYENQPSTTLHTIIALNADAVEEAKKKDRSGSSDHHPIYGMPILLKDNINTSVMKTTAGALALIDNQTEDAAIVRNLKKNGAIILGKVNLSEWAYFFCGGCPVGYSAIGGQTLNPYGRGIFETGGSSAGSGTSVTANYAVGAVGTETSGSILSPSSKNSVVGMKPTVGILSRSGIVPISSTLDTPGPMTKNVTDNAILLSAMFGIDRTDEATISIERDVDYLLLLKDGELKGKRFGIIKSFLDRDSIYASTVSKIKSLGAEIFEYEPPSVQLQGFGTLLSAEMQRDLPIYLQNYAGDQVEVKHVSDVVTFNLKDTTIRAPYGQARLLGSASDTTSQDELEALEQMLEKRGRRYFNEPMAEHNLDAILSIDNFSAGFAAVAKYPCLTIPMGYKESGEPTNLTFIGKPESETLLLQLGFAFENATKIRKPPF